VILFAFCIAIPVETSFAKTNDSAVSFSISPHPADFIKTTDDLRITDFCQLHSFFENGKFPDGDKIYLLSYDDVSERYPNYEIDETYYEEFLDATKRFGYPYFERWHQDRYDGPTESIDWMYMKEWQIHPEMFNLFENYMHKSDSKISSCDIPDESYMISHVSYDGVCAPGFTKYKEENICTLDYSCGYPSNGKICTDKGPMSGHLPPAKQKLAGIAKGDTICLEGKKLLFKQSDDSPVCLFPDSISKLVEREIVDVTGYEDILIQESTNLRITIEEPIDERGLMPILTTQVFDNAKLRNNIATHYGFQPSDNYVELGVDNSRVGWERLPPNYVLNSRGITDENGEDPIDQSRTQENRAVPSIAYGARLICGDNGENLALVEYGYPLSYPINDGTKKVFFSGNGGGLLPDDNGVYRLSFASYFEQSIKLFEKVDIISEKYEKCIIKHPETRKTNHHNSGFVNGYHHEIIFKLNESKKR